MTTVPHVLSPADSAQAEAIARAIQQHAHPADRCKIARYGMDLFQQYPTSMEDEIEFLSCLYMSDIPGVVEFAETIVDDGPRMDAFEQAVALNVHLLATNQPLPPVQITLEQS